MGVQINTRALLAMAEFTLSLLLHVSLSQGLSAIWLQSSRIEFPSTKIEPLESPFKESNRASPYKSKLEHLANFKKHQWRQASYPVVKFPETRDTEETEFPTREGGEFDSLVHFPPKSGVEDPNTGNKSPITKRRRISKTEKRRTKVDKESGCLGRSMAGAGRRRRRCRKTKKILRPGYSIFG